MIENYPETLPAQARDALGVYAPARQFDTVIEGRRSYEVGLADDARCGDPLWGTGAEAVPRSWRPTDRTVLESGVVFASYEPAG